MHRCTDLRGVSVSRGATSCAGELVSAALGANSFCSDRLKYRLCGRSLVRRSGLARDYRDWCRSERASVPDPILASGDLMPRTLQWLDRVQPRRDLARGLSAPAAVVNL